MSVHAPPTTEPPAAERRSKAPLLAALAVTGVLAITTTAIWWNGNRRPPRTIEDRGFVAQANSVCARELPALRAPKLRGQEARADRPAPQEAVKVDRAADGLEGLVTQLRAIPVDAADAGRVDQWLDDWGRYAAVGHRYAEVLRRGDDPARFTAAAREGNAIVHRMGRFARGNHIDDCVL